VTRWLTPIRVVTTIGYLDFRPDGKLIAEAGHRLSEAAAEAQVILFGSHARGDAQPGSDLDLPVVEPELKAVAWSSCVCVKP
jgi:hypothetical protein